jgi:23S rRNA (guanosine2251-2'-O)-methyltransferase
VTRRGGGSRRSRGGRGRRDAAAPERVVAGIHPVRELLRADGGVHRVVVDAQRRHSDQLEDLLARARRAGVRVDEVERDEVDELAAGQVHQGVVAVAPPFPYVPLGAVLDHDGPGPHVLVALDGITDPHNVGSIARTAEAVGAQGMLVPERRAAGVTPTVEKAAAGALAHLPVVRVTNLVRSLGEAKAAGWWVLGLDAGGDEETTDSPLLDEPVVVVVGAEGDGLARLTREACDALVRLPMRGRVASLNASVAAAVALYDVTRRQVPGDPRA